MRISIHSKLHFALRFLFGAVFIFSAIAKLFPIEIFELNLIYQEVAGWSTAPYFSRLLIATELFLGLSFFQSYKLKSLIYPLTFLLILLFTFFLTYEIIVNGNEGNCGCFGTIISMTPLESIYKNIVLFGWLFYLYKSTQEKPVGIKWLLPAFLILPLVSLFIIFPINSERSTESQGQIGAKAVYSYLKDFEGDPKADLSEGKKIVTFFNLGCDHCKEIALRIGILDKETPINSVYFILWGDPNDVDDFFGDTRTRFPYKMLPTNEYFSLTGPSVPRVTIIENGIIRHDWNYKSFNIKSFREILREEGLIK